MLRHKIRASSPFGGSNHMSNILKAKQLYMDCDNCNPNESTLMGFQVPWFKKKTFTKSWLLEWQ